MGFPKCIFLILISTTLTVGSMDTPIEGDVTIYRPPVIKLLKRVSRNFKTGQTAKLTLVFHVSRPVNIRWFLERESSLTGSEVRGFMPIHGDPMFRPSYLVAGDVVAYTLNIPNFRESMLPLVFETVISMTDASMQYNLRTKIYQSINYKLEEIDSPEWDIYPETESYEQDTRWEFNCQVYIPNEMDQEYNALNELSVFKFPLNNKLDPLKDQSRIYSLIPGTEDEVEFHERSDGDPMLITATRKVQGQNGIYHINVTTPKSTQDLAGTYQCVFKRQSGMAYDTSYSLGKQTIRDHFVTSMPLAQVTMIPCDESRWNEGNKLLTFTRGEPTCLRCRGVVLTEIGLYHVGMMQTRQVDDSEDVYVHRYYNVPDAGVHEALYIFRNPKRGIDGRYQCKVSNNVTTLSAAYNFNIALG